MTEKRPGTKPQNRLASAIGLVLIVGGASVASVAVAPGIDGLLGILLALTALAIAIIDARHFIIPNELTILAVLLGLVHAFVVAPSGTEAASLGLALFRGLLLAGCFLMLREIYFRLRHRHGLGLGDVKLAIASGVWLDFDFIALAIEIAALAAIATYLVRQFVARRAVSMAARLPFGLFLAPSIWLTWLLEHLLL
jgi:leader peptidase (prepilin peptidase)/N-methyltransferase